jgi:hypothetical protein
MSFLSLHNWKGGELARNIGFSQILAKGTNRNPMGAGTDEILHNNIGAIGLERDAVIVV